MKPGTVHRGRERVGLVDDLPATTAVHAHGDTDEGKHRYKSEYHQTQSHFVAHGVPPADRWMHGRSAAARASPRAGGHGPAVKRRQMLHAPQLATRDY